MNEKIFRRMIDGVKVAVIAVNKNLRATYSNATFQTLFSNGKSSGSLGALTGCAMCKKNCMDSEHCRGCTLIATFEDAFLTKRQVSRRVYQHLKRDGSIHEVTYTLTATPIGGGFCMGTIDDAFELEIARELHAAKSIQQKLLPVGRWAGGKRYAYAYIPCRDIGGDLPDVYTVDGKAFGMIADVSGKGVAAGMLSAFVKAAYDKSTPSPAQAITNLNDKFRELNLDERNYVTVAAVRIDSNTITYSMAGHNVPILLKTAGGVTRIMSNSPPVSSWFDRASYFDDSIHYEPGDILVLLTDGVTECRGAKGEMFGVDGAIKTLSLAKTAEDFIKNLESTLRDFSPTPLNDDITAVAFDL